MDIFERQEISKSRPQVKNKLKGWYDWLVNIILEPIKERASRAFKTFKDNVMVLYKWIKGEKEPEEEEQKEEKEEQNEQSREPEARTPLTLDRLEFSKGTNYCMD